MSDQTANLLLQIGSYLGHPVLLFVVACHMAFMLTGLLFFLTKKWYILYVKIANCILLPIGIVMLLMLPVYFTAVQHNLEKMQHQKL